MNDNKPNIIYLRYKSLKNTIYKKYDKEKQTKQQVANDFIDIFFITINKNINFDRNIKYNMIKLRIKYSYNIKINIHRNQIQ